MEKLYAHISNLEDTLKVREISNFVPAYMYRAMYREEYGKIKFDNVEINLLVGSLTRDKCPWCDSNAVVKINEIPFSVVAGSVKIWMECTRCFSRGPLLNVNSNAYISDDEKNHFHDIAKIIYRKRIEWKEA